MNVFSDPPSVAILDLLHAGPALRIDAEATDLALVLAFAGSSGGLFFDALGRAPHAPSSFQPGAFARDLFLSTFVAQCLRPSIGGQTPEVCTEHLSRLLCSPPKDFASVQLRREILSELDQAPALANNLKRVYQRLSQLRALLEGTSGHSTLDSNRRQLSILESFRTLIELLAEGFAGATSGLQRLTRYADSVRGSEGYRALVELLAYDEQMASLSFKVAIGADGRVRRLELVEAHEETDNMFLAAPWKRWLAKLELFLRGFRFGDGEVMARLLDAVFEGVRPQFVVLVQVLGDLEFYLGALGFAERARASGLEVCLPEFVESGAPRQVVGLFNPLLMGKQIPVPCDLECDRNVATTLITGPNSGGKTRLLQAIGLTQLLAQVGLFVPARAAQLAPCPGMVVSLIQETHVDQTEGRLGMELMRIRQLFECLPPGAMVILDELCSGTNPSEGEEIFELVVRMLEKLAPQAFITTHFLDFASRLQAAGAIGSLRFLQVLLGPRQEPTYQFGPGVAKTSLAAHAAARLGVTGEQLLGLIERNTRSGGAA